MTRDMNHVAGPPAGIERSSWSRRLGIALIVVAAGVVLYLIGSAIIPRWWAHRVGNVVGGSLTVGALYGLFIGFVFTMLPLLVVGLAWRTRSSRRSWKGWLGWLLVALLLAIPNLMTLGIVFGNSDAAEDGEQILSDDGNGFRTWSLVGAIGAVVAFLVLVYLVRTRGWFRDDNRRLREAARSDAPPG